MGKGKLSNWIAKLLDPDSNVSTKRLVLLLMAIWAISMGTFYVIIQQYGGIESVTTVGLIEFAFGSAITLAVGGTAAERIKRQAHKPKKES